MPSVDHIMLVMNWAELRWMDEDELLLSYDEPEENTLHIINHEIEHEHLIHGDILWSSSNNNQGWEE